MRILVVFTGGTIGCSRKSKIILPNLQNRFRLIEEYNQKYCGTDFDTVTPYYALSENLSASRLNLLADCLFAADFSKYDGIIVTHGTDTLQYVSAFLAYLFDGCGLPIVTVSANYPLNDKRTNGHDNFKCAVDFIKAGVCAGVFAAYKNPGGDAVIHRASRLLAYRAYDDALFSVCGQIFGTVKSGIFIKNADFVGCENRFEFDDNTRLSKRSGVLKTAPVPGGNAPEIGADTKAVLIESFHSGTLNTEDGVLSKLCEEARKQKVPVLLTGSRKGFNYESKLGLESLGVMTLPPASPVAMYVKLWLLPKENIDSVFLPCADDFFGNVC